MRSNVLISLVSLLAVTPALARQYNIRNWCPSAINVYLGGKLQKNLAVNGRLSLNLTDDEGFFYTDANRVGTSSNGTRAAFKLEKPYGYYYMVTDPNNFNVGMSIEPDNVGSVDGRCIGISCLAASCTNAYDNNKAPTNLTSLPTSSAPQSPLTLSITSLTIHPNGNTSFCLDVKGAKYANGTPVQLYKCNNTPAQKWVINAGSTKVKVAGTNFCLDAGSKPASGVGMKIWQCYDNLPAQAWYLTGDNRIAVEGKGQCLDLPSGKLSNGTQVQTWKCTNKNTNQIWVPS
ncbi:ricin B lectin domain-containing protein [Cyathus striatus]|nr:ricin B lectin domain-containing protein [Cyathus striatus]